MRRQTLCVQVGRSESYFNNADGINMSSCSCANLVLATVPEGHCRLHQQVSGSVEVPYSQLMYCAPPLNLR